MIYMGWGGQLGVVVVGDARVVGGLVRRTKIQKIHWIKNSVVTGGGMGLLWMFLCSSFYFCPWNWKQ